jgi:hypothetical protein
VVFGSGQSCYQNYRPDFKGEIRIFQSRIQGSANGI